MSPLDPQAAVDRLYAVPLEAFVSERNRLSRELRKGGDRPGAAEVARLPKPGAAAWALNHVAREEPEVLGGWLEAAQALRDASAHPRAGADGALREAMGGHRATTAELITLIRERAQPAGRPLSEAMLARVRSLLRAATADANLAEALRAGRIDEPGEPSGDGTVPEPAPAPAATPSRKPPKAHAPKPAPKPAPKAPRRDRQAEARAERRRELERRVSAAARELEALREEADRRAAAARSTDDAVDAARRALRSLESEGRQPATPPSRPADPPKPRGVSWTSSGRGSDRRSDVEAAPKAGGGHEVRVLVRQPHASGRTQVVRATSFCGGRPVSRAAPAEPS